MKEEYNIDKMFQEKLEGFSKEPPSFVWDGIRNHMVHSRRKKRTLLYSWVAVAALIVLAFMAGWYFNETSESYRPEIADTEVSGPQRPDSSQPSESLPYAESQNKIEEGTESRLELLASDNNEKLTRLKEETVPHSSSVAESSVPDNHSRIETPERMKPVDASLYAYDITTPEIIQVSTVPESEISESDLLTIRENISQYAFRDKEKAGWKMGVNLSPGYSSYSAKHGAVYASNMTHEASDGNASLSGGVSVRYRAAARWSVESGMYYARNGQQTGSSPQMFGGRVEADVVTSPAEQLYFNTKVLMESSHMAMNSTAGVIAIDNIPAGAEISANLENFDANGNSLITQGELSQIFDLVEIPVYLRYMLLESNFDVELVGGINAGLVVGNNAYLDSQYGVQKIGKTKEISTLNLSGTVGVGVTYALGKQFSLAVEPRFNYYLNSISKNPEVDFRPYRIGFYTGLYYNF